MLTLLANEFSTLPYRQPLYFFPPNCIGQGLDYKQLGHAHLHRIGVQTHLDEWWQDSIHRASDLQFLLNLGAIYRNGNRILDRQDLHAGDILRIHSEPRRFILPKNRPEELIVAETDDFLVVNKPAPLPVHATLDNASENLLTWLQTHHNSAVLLTHRLDQGTDGLIVFAKTAAFQRNFMRALSEGRVEKVYTAVCEDPPEPHVFHRHATSESLSGGLPPCKVFSIEGQTDSPREVLILFRHWMIKQKYAPKILLRDPTDNPSEAKLCETEILAVERIGLHWHVTLRPRTGRTHQLRAQLSFEGYPIVGDRLYGAKTNWHSENAWALRATALSFSYKLQQHSFAIPPVWD